MFADRVKGYKCIIIKNEAQQRELYVLLANNAKQDRTRDTILTWKTLAGKNHGRQSAIFTMMRELQRMEYNEPSRSSVRLTRCIYMVD
jgi:hypothetical protein